MDDAPDVTIATTSRRTMTSVLALEGGATSLRMSAMSTLPFSIAFELPARSGTATGLNATRG